jgi:hypothetical protein
VKQKFVKLSRGKIGYAASPVRALNSSRLVAHATGSLSGIRVFTLCHVHRGIWQVLTLVRWYSYCLQQIPWGKRAKFADVLRCDAA